jgi:nitrile hydratase beta subunit
MNGVHDMGGMHGFGPVAPDPNEPLFHAPWEARALALTLAAGALGRWTLDGSRHARERIPGPDYLAMSYYERWIAALEGQLSETGLATAEEIRTGAADPGEGPLAEAIPAARMVARLARGGPTARAFEASPAFAPGDRVRARNLNPAGHIRLPRYLKGRIGRITRSHGAHVLPNASAHGLGERPEPLYQVRFEAAELWGPQAQAPGAVFADLWESYLEPA